MAGISLANLDAGGLFSGIGTMAKDLRTAITGKEPISADKAAEISLKLEELQSEVEKGRVSILVAEASSQDKWTSRARPSFMYVMYVMILACIPMGIVYAVNPTMAGNITIGVKAWLTAIPDSLWALMGVGYTGYVASRSYDKSKGTTQ